MGSAELLQPQELFCMLVILLMQSSEQDTVCPEWGRNSSRKKQEKMLLLHWYFTQPQREQHRDYYKFQYPTQLQCG